MTIEDLLTNLEKYQDFLLLWYVALPLLAFVAGRLAPGLLVNDSWQSYGLSTLVFLAATPGIFAIVLVFYSLFVLGLNLLQVNIILYYVPILSMALTLFLMARATNLTALPGFGRLQGLLLLLTVTFVIWFLLLKLRVWLVFGGSMLALVAGAVIVYFLARWALQKTIGK